MRLFRKCQRCGRKSDSLCVARLEVEGFEPDKERKLIRRKRRLCDECLEEILSSLVELAKKGSEDNE